VAERGVSISNQITTVGIVGAGFMGSGIAESVTVGGFEAVLHEPSRDVLDQSRARIEASLERAAKAGKLEVEPGEIMERLRFSSDIEALAPCEIVIEAVYEDPRLKGPLFKQLDELLEPSALLASNTSSIPIAQLASWTTNRDRVIGLHFFSPVPVMKLVEIVVAIDTSADSVRRAREFSEAIGKTPVSTQDRSGFIVNMLLVPYLMASVRMFEQGFASREDIDLGMRLGAGHPMGPLTLCDFIGLDVLYAVCDSLYEEFKQAEYAPPPLLKRMVVVGHHGRKSGKGFYEYGH
jgi:3-hydroxybutyryl-CoA dehydrogenase